jgi:hypothetical protein
MIKVQITSSAVRRMQGLAKGTQKPYDISFQDAWMFLTDRDGKPDPYPTKVEVMLPKDKDGAALFYAEGNYQLHPSSVYVDQNGRLALSPRLVALAAPPAKQSA